MVSLAILVSLFWLLVCGTKGRVFGGLYRRLLFCEADALPYEELARFDAFVVSSEEKSRGQWIQIRLENGALRGYRAEGYAPVPCEPGARIRVSGTLYRPEPASNPGEFDALTYYSLRGSAFLFSASKARLVQTARGLCPYLYRLRLLMTESMRKGLPEREAGLMAAILLGEKGLGDAETKSLFQEAGIAHILAVSGLHVNLFFEAIYRLLQKLMPRRKAAGAGLIFLWFYVFLTGAAASTLRAALMLSMRLLAGIFFKQEDPAVSLAVAALVILSVQPLYICDAGFRLSFVSVLGLRYLSPLFERIYAVPRSVRRVAAPSCAAFLATAPLTLWHFYGICPYSVLLNLLVVPLMTVVYAAGALGSLAGLFSLSLSEFCFGSAYYVLRFYEELSSLTLRLPFAYLTPGRPSLLWLLAFYAAAGVLICLYSVPEKERRRAARLAGPAAIVLAAGLLCYRLPVDEAVFLNVGQGDCIYLSWHGQDCLIDAGPLYEEVIKPFLKYKGAVRLDAVFLSHPDEDHMEGLLTLWEEDTISVRTLYLADHPLQETAASQELIRLARSRGTEIVYWKRGDALQKGRTSLVCLSPEKADIFLSENDSSMVLLWKTRGHSTLFTGDLEESGEKLLLAKGLLPKAELLKVAHHGSSGASSAGFLEAVSPEAAVISALRSVYGHPHQELLERLEGRGIRVCITEQAGAVRVRYRRRLRFDYYLSKELSQ